MAKIHSTVREPISSGRASHSSRTQGSATQSAPSATQCGSRSWPRKAIQKTIAAPAMAIGASTSADNTRNRSECRSARANRGTVATLAAAIIGDGLIEVAAAEIRPERLGEHQLGISALPEQEIADALFAAGPDQQ